MSWYSEVIESYTYTFQVSESPKGHLHRKSTDQQGFEIRQVALDRPYQKY